MKEQVTSISQLKNKIKRLTSVIEINSYISNTLDRDVTLKRILNMVKNILPCESSRILLADREKEKLIFSFLSDEDDLENLKNTSIEIGESIAGTVWHTGKAVLINNTRENHGFPVRADMKAQDSIKNIAVAPLIVDGMVIGVIEAINSLKQGFSECDLELLQHISTQSGIAIKNADLYEMAIKDGLTGLFTHKHFMERLEAEWNRSLRHTRNLSLVMFDIDYFKSFNDTYGHQAGDSVLSSVAAVIQKNCRSVDIACRYGGEEFSVILPETSRKESTIFAERVRSDIEGSKVKLKNELAKISISGGIATVPEMRARNMHDFLMMSDKALYHSKNSGRNAISCFDIKRSALQ